MSAFVIFHGMMILLRCNGLCAIGPVGTVLQAYGRLTGVYASYPFFASIGGNTAEVVRLRSEVGGHEIIEKTEETWGREMTLRLNAQIVLLDYYRAEDLLGKVLAAGFFERWPCSEKVIVALLHYRIPSMSEYARGQRPRERILYEATFKPTMTLRKRTSCKTD